MRKLFLIFVFFAFCLPLHAGDFFKDDLTSKRIHVVIEGAVGGDFYRSPLSPLYKENQWVFTGTVTIGYKFNNSIYAGLGGGLRHCQNDQKTGFPIAGSFPAYAMVRYSFANAWHQPYLDGKVGTVVYPKWNDSIKFHTSIGGGIHIIPRLTAGVQCGWYGTLDNKYSFGLFFCLGFIL